MCDGYESGRRRVMDEDSPLPLLFSIPELVDDKGETVRQAHGGHTGAGEGGGAEENGNQGILSGVKGDAREEARDVTER